MASYLYSNTDFEALNTSQQNGLPSATIDSDYYVLLPNYYLNYISSIMF